MHLKLIRDNPDEVRRVLELRRCPTGIADIIAFDAERRVLALERDRLRHEQKGISQAVAEARRTGGDADAVTARARELSEQVKTADAALAGVEARLAELVKPLPNVVHPSVTAEEEITAEWGEPTRFDFQPLTHWDLCEAHELLNLKAGAELAGSRFPVFTGRGALLRRALLEFFVSTHVNRNGYTEIAPPVLANLPTLEGSGQLPHLETEMYAVRDDALYLIPTSETMLANLHRGRTLEDAELPRKYVANSLCFRREAGSYGRDVRGITRVHQFDKVELVRFVRPDESYAALEEMVDEACFLLRELEIPYRVKRLAAWDIAWQSAKTYDIEAWAGGEGKWLEVSSVSNCEEFQARRCGTRRRGPDGVGYPHILNGSALALPRTFIALVENRQQADGSIVIPEKLRPFAGGLERIS
ncbi:MAG TPA: serine--tRNA ligase [candidate division WOR-3 bacterium]|uniref:Serine--tRNA ligase n=1 Tax=candidate division WOR-3 bacterium TaxID=2052148 RepID=A0A7V0XF63_UNCW3|nr:serine--tRNA ligase [candidate division WOR-3 bacterium]